MIVVVVTTLETLDNLMIYFVKKNNIVLFLKW